MQQQPIHFARASDGVTIAYTTHGTGMPLLVTPGWVSHLEMDLENPRYVQFLEGLADQRKRRLVRFDFRGTGLSDREVTSLSNEDRARDFEAIVDHLGLDKVAIFSWSMSGPAAIIYAATHPEKVSHLILYATYARSFETGREALGRALVDLIRADWRIGSRAIVDFVYPHGKREMPEDFTAYTRAAASGEVAASLLEEAFFQTDIRQYLDRLTMPTLVLHRRDDQAFPMAAGRELASLLPHAHFIPLPGEVHIPYDGNTAAILDAVSDFLSAGDHHAAATAADEHAHEHAQPTGGLQTILFTDMEGSTGFTQRLGDAQAQELVRLHNSIVREALHTHSGAEVKHTGDGIMATFNSTTRAIDCAIAIERACDEHARDHPTSPFQVRIGLNAGEPVTEEDDLFGTAVQLASRVCTHASPGQILASNVVRELAAGKRFLWSDQGNVALRGFEDPVRIFEVKWRS